MSQDKSRTKGKICESDLVIEYTGESMPFLVQLPLPNQYKRGDALKKYTFIHGSPCILVFDSF